MSFRVERRNADWKFLKVPLALKSLQKGPSRLVSQKELLLLQGISWTNAGSLFKEVEAVVEEGGGEKKS